MPPHEGAALTTSVSRAGQEEGSGPFSTFQLALIVTSHNVASSNRHHETNRLHFSTRTLIRQLATSPHVGYPRVKLVLVSTPWPLPCPLNSPHQPSSAPCRLEPIPHTIVTLPPLSQFRCRRSPRWEIHVSPGNGGSDDRSFSSLPKRKRHVRSRISGAITVFFENTKQKRLFFFT